MFPTPAAASAQFPVRIWNGEHTTHKHYKTYTNKPDAEIAVAALRVHGMEAFIQPPQSEEK